MPPFRLLKRPLKKAPPSVPLSKATPPAAAPSSQRATAPSQARRGLSPEAQTQLIKTGKVAAVATGAVVATRAIGGAVSDTFTARAAFEESRRARADYISVPLDTNGDGIPDASSNVPLVTGPNGAYDTFGLGGVPTHSQAAAPTTAGDWRETAKTLGLVVGGLVVVGGVVYVVTRPGVAKKLMGAIR